MASRFSLIFVSLFLILTVLLFPRWEKQYTEAPIAWDVSGYYLYLPALFIYDDIEELKFFPDIIEKYKPSFSPDQAFPYDNGNRVMKYPAGMAVLYSPFFFTAHLVALNSDFPADGFSLPYQIAIQLGGLFAAIIGLLFLQKILIRFFSDYTTAWAILLIGIGTNFFNYGTFDSGNVHVWSFALLSILTYSTILFHENPKWKYAIGVGTCIGLAALVRPTEIIFALIPLLWGIMDKGTFIQKINFLKKHFLKILGAAIITLSIGFIQLIYWKTVAGDWLVYSYEDQGFSFNKPHFESVFFSYRKGWFVYTPLMLFAVLGIIFFYKKWKERNIPYLLPTLLFLLINTWIIASWDIWWYGGAFGQRAMIASYALLAFPLALLINEVNKRRLLNWAIYPIFIGCIVLNLFQTYQAHWGPWESQIMNKAYYWKIFANHDNSEYDKLLLDTHENYDGEKNNLITVIEYDCEPLNGKSGTSNQIVRSGKTSLFLEKKKGESSRLIINKEKEHENYEWANICGWFFSPEPEHEYWWMPQMVIQFKNDDTVVKESIYRPNRISRLKQWNQVCVNIKLPEKEFNQFELFLRNPRDKVNMYADDLWLGLFKE